MPSATKTYRVVCEDGAIRHQAHFESRRQAEDFAEWGHVCTNRHEIEVVCTNPHGLQIIISRRGADVVHCMHQGHDDDGSGHMLQEDCLEYDFEQ